MIFILIPSIVWPVFSGQIIEGIKIQSILVRLMDPAVTVQRFKYPPNRGLRWGVLKSTAKRPIFRGFGGFWGGFGGVWGVWRGAAGSKRQTGLLCRLTALCPPYGPNVKDEINETKKGYFLGELDYLVEFKFSYSQTIPAELYNNSGPRGSPPKSTGKPPKMRFFTIFWRKTLYWRPP